VSEFWELDRGAQREVGAVNLKIGVVSLNGVLPESLATGVIALVVYVGIAFGDRAGVRPGRPLRPSLSRLEESRSRATAF